MSANLLRSLPIALLLTQVLLSSACATDWYATYYDATLSVPRWGNSPYDDPLATLGEPATWVNMSGEPGATEISAVSMVLPAWNVAPDDGIHGSGEKLVTTILSAGGGYPAGQLTVRFASPIYDDPANWYQKDFIIFGNGFFAVSGSSYTGSAMEDVVMSADAGWFRPALVSVSQDGLAWYSYDDGPYADDYAPTHAYAWDWVNHTWLENSSGSEVQLDFTRPVDSDLLPGDFSGKTPAAGIDMYKGSGGGTAFDISGLALPVDPVTGTKWIQYIQVGGSRTVVDAFARVSHAIAPVSIGEAKKLPDGSRVVLNGTVVSAATYETGRSCYIEHSDRSGGIKIMGRIMERGKHYMICGDMDTVDGERVIQVTSAQAVMDGEGNEVTSEIKPLGMPNKSVGGMGLSSTGLLVSTWGRVKSVDQAAKSFAIDDGSGRMLKCVAPRDTQTGDPDKGSTPDPSFVPPSQNAFVIVTGISSCELVGSELVSVLRLRTGEDLQ